MKKFEYKVVAAGLVSGQTIAEFEVGANKLGEDGWELALIARNDYAVYKREMK